MLFIVVEDECCRALSKEHSIDVNICLSSMKSIMNLEKPNSLWIIPVNVDIGNHYVIFDRLNEDYKTYNNLIFRY